MKYCHWLEGYKVEGEDGIGLFLPTEGDEDVPVEVVNEHATKSMRIGDDLWLEPGWKIVIMWNEGHWRIHQSAERV